jgi:hypothetical protein
MDKNKIPKKPAANITPRENFSNQGLNKAEKDQKSRLLYTSIQFYDDIDAFEHHGKRLGFVDKNTGRMLNKTSVVLALICEGLTAFNNNPEYDEIFKAMGRKMSDPYPKY